MISAERRRRTPIWLVTALTIILVASGTQQASAYVLTGQKWGSSSVTYNISSGAWATAVSSWNVKVSSVQFVKSSSAKLALGTANNSSVTWDGLAEWSHSSGQITDARARLNNAYVKNYSTAKVKSVAVHELGHILGLAHRSGCVLMNPTTSARFDSCNVNTAQADDVAGVNSLYQ